MSENELNTKKTVYTRFYMFTEQGLRRLIELNKTASGAVNLFLIFVYKCNTKNEVVYDRRFFINVLDCDVKSFEKYMKVLIETGLIKHTPRSSNCLLNANVVLRCKTKNRKFFWTANEEPLKSNEKFFQVNQQYLIHLVALNMSNNSPIALLFALICESDGLNCIHIKRNDLIAICGLKKSAIYNKTKALEDANIIRIEPRNGREYIINPNLVFHSNKTAYDSCEYGGEKQILVDTRKIRKRINKQR